MQKLKIVFLIISLVQLSSCGKKSDEDQNNANLSTEKTPQEHYDPRNNEDFDGDLIPNFLDPEPFIADSPLANIKFKMRSNQLPSGELIFDLNQIDRHQIIQNIGANFRDADLKYNLDLGLTAKQVQISANQQLEIQSSLVTTEDISMMHFEIRKNNQSIFTGELDESNQVESKINSNLMLGHPLKLKIIDFNFKRADQIISYQNFQASLKKHTYRVTIIPADKELKTYQVAHKIGLHEGLKVAGYNELEISELLSRNSGLYLNDLQHLQDEEGSWIVLNHNLKPKAGEHIIFLFVKAKELKNLPQQQQSLESFFYAPDFSFQTGDSKLFRFKISGHFLYAHPKSTSYPVTCIQGSHPWKTSYELVTVHNEKYSMNMSNIKNFMGFFQNGQDITAHLQVKNGYYELSQNSAYQEIQVKLNSSFPRSAIRGIPKPKTGWCGYYLQKPDGQRIQYYSEEYNPILEIEFKMEAKREPLMH